MGVLPFAFEFLPFSFEQLALGGVIYKHEFSRFIHPDNHDIMQFLSGAWLERNDERPSFFYVEFQVASRSLKSKGAKSVLAKIALKG